MERVMIHFDGDRTWLHSLVIMPNHVHVHVLVSLSENVTLEETMRAWKGASARRINELCVGSGVVWGRNYFDRMIRDRTHFSRVAKYIRNNPVKAELEEGEYTLRESEAVQRLLK